MKKLPPGLQPPVGSQKVEVPMERTPLRRTTTFLDKAEGAPTCFDSVEIDRAGEGGWLVISIGRLNKDRVQLHRP